MGNVAKLSPPRYTKKTRSSVILGGPLPGYYTENDEMSAQMKEYQKLYDTYTKEVSRYFYR